jgi:hypothetical protein
MESASTSFLFAISDRVSLGVTSEVAARRQAPSRGIGRSTWVVWRFTASILRAIVGVLRHLQGNLS